MDIQKILGNKINNLDEAAESITEDTQLELLFDELTSKDDKYRYNCFLLLEKITLKKSTGYMIMEFPCGLTGQHKFISQKHWPGAFSQFILQ